MSIESRPTVDHAALILAGVAATVSLITASGAWSRASSFVGFSLMFIVIAFHRNGEPPSTARHWMIRVVYGIVLGLALCIALAYWFQGALSPTGEAQDAQAGEVLDALLFWAFPIAAIFGTACEPMVERALDKPRS